MLRSCSLVLAAMLICCAPSSLRGQTTLYSVANNDALLRTLNQGNGATFLTVTMTAPAQTIDGCTGLASHPITNDLYVVLKLAGQMNRSLGLVDPLNGMVQVIGDLGDRFSGITFDAGGVLYGVTGDGATVPETLYTINLVTAATTLFQALGNGDDGEAIAYRTPSGLIYHASGLGTAIVETIAPGGAIAPITVTGASYDEVLGFTYDPTNDQFWFSDLCDFLFIMTPGGAVTQFGILDHTSKGMAFVGVPQLPKDFMRGDCNLDGAFNIADAIFELGNLFPMGPPNVLECLDACDANDDGNINLADPIAILNALFGVPPISLAPPFFCGQDPTPDPLDCVFYPICGGC